MYDITFILSNLLAIILFGMTLLPKLPGLWRMVIGLPVFAGLVTLWFIQVEAPISHSVLVGLRLVTAFGLLIVCGMVIWRGMGRRQAESPAA